MNRLGAGFVTVCFLIGPIIAAAEPALPRLFGTVIEDDRYAIIAARDHGQRLYRVGDRIGTFRIGQIEDRYVVFERDKVQYRVYFSGQTQRVEASKPESTPKPVNQDPVTTAHRVVYVERAVTDRFHDNVRWLRDLSFSLYLEEGAIGGYEVDLVRAGTWAEQLGFEQGDIILAVNNEPLDNPRTFASMLGGFENSPAVDFFIKRGDRNLHLYMVIN